MPFLAPLVVKNGSKMRARFSGAMPAPESATVTRTSPSRLAVCDRQRAARFHGVARIQEQIQKHLLQLARIPVMRGSFSSSASSTSRRPRSS